MIDIVYSYSKKRFIHIKIVFLFFLFINCQDVLNRETIIQKKKQEEAQLKVIEPKGNQLFKQSVKLQYLQNVNGYILTSTEVKPCENSGGGVENLDDDKKVKEITFTENGFIIDFIIVENCCSEFLCEAEIVDETTLNIIYHPFGNHCSCNCKFEIKYTFTIDNSLQEIGKQITTIKHVQFNNDVSSKVNFEK